MLDLKYLVLKKNNFAFVGLVLIAFRFGDRRVMSKISLNEYSKSLSPFKPFDQTNAVLVRYLFER